MSKVDAKANNRGYDFSQVALPQGAIDRISSAKPLEPQEQGGSGLAGALKRIAPLAIALTSCSVPSILTQPTPTSTPEAIATASSEKTYQGVGLKIIDGKTNLSPADKKIIDQYAADFSSFEKSRNIKRDNTIVLKAEGLNTAGEKGKTEIAITFAKNSDGVSLVYFQFRGLNPKSGQLETMLIEGNSLFGQPDVLNGPSDDMFSVVMKGFSLLGGSKNSIVRGFLSYQYSPLACFDPNMTVVEVTKSQACTLKSTTIVNPITGEKVVAQNIESVSNKLIEYASLADSIKYNPNPTILIPPGVDITKTPIPPTRPPSTPRPAETKTTSVKLKVAPEVKSVLDAQKAPYKVSESGEAVITVAGKEITLTSLVDTKTDFGLAEDILNGRDKEGVRYIFTEIGWVKDIDVANTTPENKIMVPFQWTIKAAGAKTTALNIVNSLHYAENPTISPDAKDPHYNITLYGTMSGTTPILTFTTRMGDDPEGRFTVDQKPFSWSGFYETTTPAGKNIVILAQTRKNPTPENKDQLINLFFGFDGENYAVYIKRNNDPNVYPKGYANNAAMLQFINENITEFAPVIPPPENFNGDSIRFDLDNFAFYKQSPNPAVAKLQKRGELFRLFSESEQLTIEAQIRNFTKDADSKRIIHIPEGFANTVLLVVFHGWGNTLQ